MAYRAKVAAPPRLGLSADRLIASLGLDCQAVSLFFFQQDMSDSDEEEEKSESSDSDEDETSGSTDSEEDDEEVKTSRASPWQRANGEPVVTSSERG